jgi:hypothetical protein
MPLIKLGTSLYHWLTPLFLPLGIASKNLRREPRYKPTEKNVTQPGYDIHSLRTRKSPFIIGKSIISMINLIIFNSYVKLPEGNMSE